MAGNSNSGNVLAFKLSEKELETKLNTYKIAVESGEIPRASWANLCAYLGYTEIEVGEVIARDQANSAYYSRAVALKRALTWVRGQLASGNGWSGQNQSRAIFLLKQDHGDGIRYSDQDAKQTGPIEVKVSFGGSDSRAKKAGR